MNLFVTVLLIAFFIIAWLLLRLLKRRDKAANRYRHYHAKRSINTKSQKVRPNRYHKSSRREPNLGYSQSLAKQPQEPSLSTSLIGNSKRNSAIAESSLLITSSETDDPDVILGLKEPAAPNRERPIPNDAQITLKPPPQPPPIMTLHVMAEKGEAYNGYELLQTILSIGLRYGEHQIFHRHETKTGQGAILFSLSSAVKPGTFDLETMGNFSTPGLSLFFVADQVEDPIAVYELMLQAAGQFVEELAGHVLDENRQLLTPAKIVQHRQSLRRYIEGQHVPDLFETLDEQ